MKALTVQQPWAWAIVHGGKDVENRTQAWAYRGDLLIHAGARLSQRGCELLPDLLDGADDPDLLATYADAPMDYSALIGVVAMFGAHTAQPSCCASPWAEQSYDEHGGRTRRDVVHLELANPRPLEPIPCRGRLGLWTPGNDLIDQVTDQLEVRWQ